MRQLAFVEGLELFLLLHAERSREKTNESVWERVCKILAIDNNLDGVKQEKSSILSERPYHITAQVVVWVPKSELECPSHAIVLRAGYRVPLLAKESFRNFIPDLRQYQGVGSAHCRPRYYDSIWFKICSVGTDLGQFLGR